MNVVFKGNTSRNVAIQLFPLCSVVQIISLTHTITAWRICTDKFSLCCTGFRRLYSRYNFKISRGLYYRFNSYTYYIDNVDFKENFRSGKYLASYGRHIYILCIVHEPPLPLYSSYNNTKTVFFNFWQY